MSDVYNTPPYNVPGVSNLPAQAGSTSTSTSTGTVPVTTVAASGTAQTLPFPSAGNAAFDITKTGNVALTISGGNTGQYQTVTLILRPGAGGFTESFVQSIKWPGGTPPTPSTSAINVYYVSTSDGGATLLGSY